MLKRKWNRVLGSMLAVLLLSSSALEPIAAFAAEAEPVPEEKVWEVSVQSGVNGHITVTDASGEIQTIGGGENKILNIADGAVIQTEAVPDSGYDLESYVINENSQTENQTEITVHSNVSVTATFKAVENETLKTEELYGYQDEGYVKTTIKPESTQNVTIYYSEGEPKARSTRLFAARSASVTLTRGAAYTYPAIWGGRSGSHRFYLNGQLAYCVNPQEPEPGTGTYPSAYGKVSTTTNEMVLRVLSFGFNGMNDCTEKYLSSIGRDTSENTRYSLTHIAASVAFGDSNPYYKANATCKSDVQGFLNYIKGLPFNTSGMYAQYVDVTGMQTIIRIVGDKKFMAAASLQIYKRDSKTNAELSGTVFELYAWDGSSYGTYVGTFKDNGNGSYVLNNIDVTKEWFLVVEQQAPSGYKKPYGFFSTKDQTDYNTYGGRQFQYTSNGWYCYSLQDYGNPSDGFVFKDEANPGKIKIQKASANPDVTNGNPCYSLAGAVYGVYQNGNEVNRLTIKADGSSDEISLYPGTYQVKEISAPSNGSYYLDTKTYTVTVGAGKLSVCNTSDVPANDPAAIQVSKVDSEGNKVTGVSLAGTQFTMKYYNGYYDSVKDLPEEATRTWVLETKERKNSDGTIAYRAILANECKVSGDAFFVDSANNPVIPLGTITIQETKAAPGYNLDNNITNNGVTAENGIFLAKVEKAGDAVVLNYGDTKITEEGFTAQDTIKRADLSFTKVDDNGKGMAFIPFLIKNKATGETHVIVSDQNGVVDTTTVKHNKNTNSLDSYSDGKNFTDESRLKDIAGIWFGDGEVNNSRGALVYGDYYIRELKCKANAGKDLIETEFSVTEDKGEIKLDAQINHEITIKTTATDKATDTHTAVCGKETTIVDTVKYSGVKEGRTYTMKGQLVRKDTKEVLATAEKEFIPENTAGSIELTFTFDSSKLQGKEVVAFETVYWDGLELQSHADLNDEDQTVYFPTVKTKATDDASETQVGVRNKEDIIKDIVEYTGLSKGETYVVRGKLMSLETGGVIKDNGKDVTSEVKFTPKESDGSVVTSFTWDSRKFDGTAVVYQSIYLLKNGKEYKVIEAADLHDEAESVYYPSISTSAKDGQTQDHVGTLGKTTIVDTVTYTNLKIGEKYTVNGVLMDKESGKEFRVNGKPVTASVSFTAEKENGTVDLVYTLDASALEGKTLVVFEDLLHKNLEVATHHDIEDEEQSVHYPKIRTTASDGKTNSHMGTSAKKITLTDTVSYSNLIPGQEYTVKGTLIDNEGEKIVQDGKEITAEAVFTPDKEKGTVKLTFAFDSSVLEGKTTVVFEKLFHREIEVARHEDPSDEDQSVHFPKIHTTATDGQTGDKEGVVGESVTIKDVVAYENLIPGNEYTVKGTAMVKETGEPALNKDGGKAESELTFVAEKADSEVTLEFELDSTGLKDVVIFEKLYFEKVNITSHEDIEDDGQTVHYPEIHTTNIDKSTGDHQGSVSEATTLIDTVEYKNLIVGHEYTVTGQLMKKVAAEPEKDESESENAGTDTSDSDETGAEESGNATSEESKKPVYKEEPVLVDGKPVIASTTFTAEETDGSVDVIFTFNTNVVSGETIVAFESLSYQEVELTTHADINDESQTVYVPEIHTSAVDAETGLHNSYRDDHITIIDTVTYRNLIPGNTYVLRGTLQEKMEDGTAKAVEARLVAPEIKADQDLDEDVTEDASKEETENEEAEETFVNETTEAVPVTGYTRFTPETPDGTVDVIFSFDGSNLSDTEHIFVAFEELYYKDALVEEHKDIDDTEQTVYVPHIQTELTDKESGSHNMLADETVTLEDTVEYKGLIPGKTYVMTGILMDQATGESIKVNGKEVTGETEFVPEAADGKVVVTFTFDGSGLEGKNIVAFETCTYEGKDIAIHTDIKDEKQTIYVPKLHTTATDKADGDKKLTSKGTLHILDKIEYTNLIPGQEYTVQGVLMDKATKESLKVGGKEVVAKKTFVPDSANGYVTVEFVFNGNNLGDKTLVAFETLYLNDSPVGEHKDIDDADQTVTLVTPPTPSKIVKTGDTDGMLIALALAAICAAAGIGLFMAGRKKK